MDTTLPLHPLGSLLPLDQPFTPAMARGVGIDRVALERLVREGTVHRILRGVYASSTVQHTIGLRAAAVGLALAGRRGIVVDRTAAWVHGAWPGGQEGSVPDVLTPGRAASSPLGGRRGLGPRDVELVGSVRVTTPLRTALDLGRLLSPDRALGVMDGLLRGGSFSHTALLAELPRFSGHRGVHQLRSLAAQVDARAQSMAESALRLHWNAARLPTPVPGMPVAAGGRLVRLSLAVERRQFAVLLASQASAADLHALEGAGWCVVVVSEHQVLETDPAVWVRHLEREWHQHLLAQLRDEEEVG